MIQRSANATKRAFGFWFPLVPVWFPWIKREFPSKYRGLGALDNLGSRAYCLGSLSRRGPQVGTKTKKGEKPWKRKKTTFPMMSLMVVKMLMKISPTCSTNQTPTMRIYGTSGDAVVVGVGQLWMPCPYL